MGVMRKRTRLERRATQVVTTPPRNLGPTVRFEVFRNGERVARAGMPGFAVVTVGLTWVRRDLRRFPPGTSVRAEDLFLHVGALDSNDRAWSRHVRWVTPGLRVGDCVEIRLSDDQRLDPPSSENRYRNRKRPEPPPMGDPSRTAIRDAVVWPAPKGVYLKAMDEKNGGPVTLSGRQATLLARAIEMVARGPRRRRKSVGVSSARAEAGEA